MQRYLCRNTHVGTAAFGCQGLINGLEKEVASSLPEPFFRRREEPALSGAEGISRIDESRPPAFPAC
jgi:hypothetical protein